MARFAAMRRLSTLGCPKAGDRKMVLRLLAVATAALALSGCVNQVGADLATVCSTVVANQKGSEQRPECDDYWRQQQVDAYRAGGPAAMAAARQQALAAGNVARPLPGQL
jgi:hypothetical protein